MDDDDEVCGSCWDLAMVFLSVGSHFPDGFLFWLFHEGGLCFGRSACEAFPG